MYKWCFVLLSLPIVASATQECFDDSMPQQTPDIQFVVHGDGTVTDTRTGLMWMQCAEGLSDEFCSTGSQELYTWQGALDQAQELNTNGGFASHIDWRVPNVAELLTLVEEQCNQPSINLNVFPGTESAFFWSGSPNQGNADATWFVDFKFGASGNVLRDGLYPVRLVRSIQ